MNHSLPRLKYKSKPKPRFSRRAFTLVELTIVIGIIAILAVLVLVVGRQVQQKAYSTKCLSRMKDLYLALDAHTKDHDGVWPQVSMELEAEQYWKAWQDILVPYKMMPEDWLCPAEEVELKRMEEKDRPKYDSSYSITHFDDNPNTAFLWQQPWIMERGDFHGSGPQMMMPDGSVQQAPITGSFGKQ